MPRLRDHDPVCNQAIPTPAPRVRRSRRSPPARYFVRQRSGGWYIEYDGGEYGPYKDSFEAMIFAIDAAQKLGARGRKAQVELLGQRGRASEVWSCGSNPHPPLT